MSNYPLRYRLTWLPRFVAPMLGDGSGFAAKAETLLPGARDTMRLVFLGDISAVASQGTPSVEVKLRDVLASADLVIGNCESPVVERPRFRAATRLGIRHSMTGGFLAGLLDAAGMDPARTVLSLANNHMLDQGAEGFDETLAALDRVGIRTIGAVRDGLPSVVEAKQVRIAFIAFTQWRNASKRAFAGRVVTIDGLSAGNWRAADRGDADLICAVPHWDWEFRHQPRPETRVLARQLVDRGVGLIAGHHAHIVQPVERIGDAIVAYGLGDFLGTAWPRVRRPLKTGAMLIADISADEGTRGKVARYEFMPFHRTREAGRERLALKSEIGK